MEENLEWPAIGIDLGTRNSSVAIWEKGRVEIIVNDQGNRKTPSCVAFTDNECLVGDAAKNQIARNPTNTVFDVKKLIGRKFSDATVQSDVESWPFKVIGDSKNDKPNIVVSYKGEKQHFTAEKISSLVLEKMKETAEAYLGAKVKHAVITVPAYFNDSQRKATEDAGIMAGLSTIRIISEPTAALIAYDFHKMASSCCDNNNNVLIFDLRGGSLDVSLLTINKKRVEFKSVSGHSQLGGDDFDKVLASNFVKTLNNIFGTRDVDENQKDLVASCERAKRILSTTSETVCQHNGSSVYITRAKFELLSQDLFDECMQHVEKCLRNAKMGRSDIERVVLVGASTKIPKVPQMLQQFFPRTKLYNTLNAEETVAYGAAIHAAMLSGVYKSPTFPSTENRLGVSVEESYLVPGKRFRREVQTKVQDISPLFIIQDIDHLLDNFPDSKASKQNCASFSSSKAELMKLLEEIRLKPNDLGLTQRVSQLLKGIYPSLPKHVRTVVKSLEEDLLTSQNQFMGWTSKEVAIPLKLEESGTIQSRLVKIKTQILEKTSSRNGLKSKIAGIEKEIAKLMDSKSQLEQDLSAVEQDLHRLTRSVEPQLDLARQQSVQLSQLREFNNFKCKAISSIEVTLDGLANYLGNL